MKMKIIKDHRDMKVSIEQYELDPADMIDFAVAYSSLGDAVCEQFHDIVSDPSDAAHTVNANALQLIADKLMGYSQEIDMAINECIEQQSVDDFENEEDDDGSWQYAARANGFKTPNR